MVPSAQADRVFISAAFVSGTPAEIQMMDFCRPREPALATRDTSDGSYFREPPLPLASVQAANSRICSTTARSCSSLQWAQTEPLKTRRSSTLIVAS